MRIPMQLCAFQTKKNKLGAWTFEKYSEIINNIHGILSIQNLELSLNKTEPLGNQKHKTQPSSSYYLIPLFYTNASKGQKTYGTFKGGLDLKYGINDAFTLDMILIPDFGQTNMMIRY
jgi:hypothetical protein